MARWHPATIVALATLGLQGCLAPYPLEASLRDNVPLLRIARQAPEQTAARELRVLYVHGIGCTEMDYSAAFQVNLVRQLGFRRDPSAPLIVNVVIRQSDATGDEVAALPDRSEIPAAGDPINDALIQDRRSFLSAINGSAARSRFESAWRDLGIPDLRPGDDADAETRYADYARLRGIRDCAATGQDYEGSTSILERGFVNDVGDRLTFIEVLWSPASERLKRQTLGYDFLAPSPESEPLQGSMQERIENRAMVNAAVKGSILDARLSDAVFYLGNSGGETVRRTVSEGLERLLFDQAEATPGTKGCDGLAVGDREYLIVTESLGSRALFDTLMQTGEEEGGCAVEALSAAPTTIAFFANQLPLLEIAQESRSEELPSNVLDLARNQWRTAADLSEPFSRNRRERDFRLPSLLTHQFVERAYGCADGIDRAARATGEDTAEARAALAALNGGSTLDHCSVSANLAPQVTSQLLEYASRDWIENEERMAAIRAVRALTQAADTWMLLRGGDDGRGSLERLDNALREAALSRADGLIVKCRRERDCSDDDIALIERSEFERSRWTFHAFSDPNDILSYELPDDWNDDLTMLSFVNVPVRVTNPVLPIEGPAGLFVMPDRAHTNHRFSETVMEVLTGGTRPIAELTPPVSRPGSGPH